MPERSAIKPLPEYKRVEEVKINRSPSEVDSRLSTLISDVTEGRRIPSKVLAYLEYLISSRDEQLLAILRDSSEERIAADAVARVLEDMDSLWQQICLPGKQAKDVSAKDRDEAKAKTNSINLVYGEIAFKAFATALCKHANMPERGTFYDIGSGAGRGLFCAAISHDFADIKGIEIGSGLVRACKDRVENYLCTHVPLLQTEAKARGVQCLLDAKFTVTEGDLRQIDWTDGDVILASSTCFDNELMQYIADESEKMKIGSTFLTFTKRLNSDHWQLIESKQYMMSWGFATLKTHIKVKPARKGPKRSDADDEAGAAVAAVAASVANLSVAWGGDIAARLDLSNDDPTAGQFVPSGAKTP